MSGWNSLNQTGPDSPCIPAIGVPVLVKDSLGQQFVAIDNGSSWQMPMPDGHVVEVDLHVEWWRRLPK